MNSTGEHASLMDGGVTFTVVTVDFTKHDCIISKEALDALSKNQSGDFGPLEIFQANEARIRGVARRMIAARVKCNPLRIEPQSFH
ncbi:MAG: hypothetical protein K0S28_2187 [Paucimonas sp.]|nr:hypothetical protein [Paucimonas sp.]